MTQEELVKAIAHAVTLYINAPEYFDENPQLRINPATFDVVAINGKDMLEGIADNEEAIEDEAAAQGDETEDATDWQAAQDPDFYAIKDYVVVDAGGKMHLDNKAIEQLAKSYIG
ncbi:MAG: hypothetical protein K2H15_07355 [Muribaculaceae bacterium]|nr:hypothetical protein [Muribaculaceae bacterium]